MKKNILISPSVLAADFSKLGEEIQLVSEEGADLIHLDVMDGHFVPNLSFGADIIKGIRGFSNLPFDVHLMIENPEHYVDAYLEAGANFITVHPEATPHIHSVLQKIHKAGVKTGIALNPGTPIEALENVIDIIDLILVMTVNPGFGGQSFLSSQLPKVSKIRTIIDDGGHSIDLSVDGGINPITAKLAIDAGANILVAGTSIFKAGDETYSKSIKRLRNLNP
ncbi:MAG: ribulose-phosphate 3-epimerase [Pseudomonadota bacterium]|nr:ribulose-phosphate 3-epimerase [Pseudomonadota bacterium]